MRQAPDRPEWNATLPIWIGLVAIAVLIAGTLFWAVGSQIAGAVVTTGVVEIESDRQVIQHPDGGVVGEILARDGDRVDAGQPLVRFDGTFIRSELDIVELQMLELHARQARLKAERDGAEELSIDLPDALAHLEPALVADQIGGQESLFLARLDSVQKETDQLTEQQTQIEAQIDGLNAQLDAAEAERALVEAELKDQQDLFQRGLVPAARVSELRRAQARLSGDIGRLKAEIGRSGTRVTEISIQKLRISDKRREDAITQLRDLGYSQIELSERRRALLEQLSRLELRAPVAGLVFGSTVKTVQSVVRPADPMMYIVPTDRPVQVAARIDPVHVDDIYPGQQAALRFTSFDRKFTPEIMATVRRISADAVYEERTGASYYEAILVPEESADLTGAGLEVLPGMPVEVFLRTADRTPMAYLTKPFTDYFHRAFREN